MPARLTRHQRFYPGRSVRLASWAPPLVWMVVILGFSSDQLSGEHSGRAVTTLLVWLFPAITPAEIRIAHAMLRKCAHFAEYTVLALLWSRSLTNAVGHGRRVRVGLATLAISVAWAALDEARQALVPHRTASVADVVIDTAGALTAIVFASFARSRSVELVTTVLLALAVVAGTSVLVMNVAVGARVGTLWLTAPASLLALIVFRSERLTARTLS